MSDEDGAAGHLGGPSKHGAHTSDDCDDEILHP
jgi:hypothetical protein